MSMLTHREYHGPFGDLFDWLESPPTIFRPFAGNTLRMEDYVKEGVYVLRAELPGIDQDKDLEVTLSKGILTIKADRPEETGGKHHSEFRYGTFARSITLPVGADEKHIQACYDKGVLEVTVGLKDQEAEKAQRRIPVMLNKHINPT